MLGGAEDAALASADSLVVTPKIALGDGSAPWAIAGGEVVGALSMWRAFEM